MSEIVPSTPRVVNPAENPSYPRRVHIGERAQWNGILQHWEERIATARQDLDTLGDSSDRARLRRTFIQMLGARDQIAEAAHRLPREVGDLYREDRQRLESAVAALERLFDRWGRDRPATGPRT